MGQIYQDKIWRIQNKLFKQVIKTDKLLLIRSERQKAYEIDV